jgi:16S rRNA (adenine1518-N6/adenine1519-N6)-dimethyltransferase
MSSSRPPRPAALKRFGQNHLVDTNTLRSIVAMAAVQPGDVVLEVGSAGGLLTEHLIAQATAVHAIEIDMRFGPALEQLADAHPGLHVRFGDALRMPLDELSPQPTALVANLAYSIAIPLIMRSIATLPTVRRWAVMVQKELGERLFAVPSTKAYSAVSVLVQLACVREAARAVPRTVFSPQPRVDSLFVTFVRREAGAGVPTPAQYAAIDRLVRCAFAQRRKLLINSLTGATYGNRTVTRDDVRDALVALGLPPTTRPEELTPPTFVDLARELAWISM